MSPQSPSPLSGRLAVVTGAARGLGACMVRALVRRGATVALVGLEEAELERVVASFPGRAHHWCADISDEAALTEVAARVQQQLGPPSVGVANAGVAAVGSFLQSDADTWRRVIEVNLIGSSLTARAFVPGLLTTRGYYLQVASLASMTAAPMMSAYCASKSGVEAFAHALRARLPWPAGKVYRPQAVAGRVVRGMERRAPARTAGNEAGWRSVAGPGGVRPDRQQTAGSLGKWCSAGGVEDLSGDVAGLW
ncbi:short-chain dehydrogenase [Streptomyces glebosus]|uniref:Short-chain dehydrogenase n=1 Tax=Streptomyces glebosus TaxID=249580 RepID=A0A640SUX8_9ACTN|nr:SDR family NAD(P)-dependent oxidoreductase [Streptomyces glebosus]GFE13345.1 short-chain dehydrogenase [Streptomyces glebosus]GHG66332.1 short-chain dehydrogenase [Streptomyces glebosus]